MHSIKQRLSRLLRYNPYCIPSLLFLVAYCVAFYFLEHHEFHTYHVIDLPIDHALPFLPIFIIPYMLWFFFIAAVYIYTMLADRREFIRLSLYLAIGMSIFLLLSFLYPNIHQLRPSMLENDVFSQLVLWIYSKDTPTNLFPSIHVYNTLACMSTVFHSRKLRRERMVYSLSWVLTVLIILSTMLVKQHSVFDVIIAFILAAGCHLFLYPEDFRGIC